MSAAERWVMVLQQLARMNLELASRRQHGPGTGIKR